MLIEDAIGKRIPLAIAIALLLQAGTAVWWAASTEAEARYTQERIAALDAAAGRSAANQLGIIDRLARLEEQARGSGNALARIEARLGTGPK